MMQPAPHSSIVRNTGDANNFVLEGDSIAMNVMMLITSELCRHVAQCHPTMVGVACAPTGDYAHARQRPTPDKGTWTEWLRQFMMHDVQLRSDFQPSNQQLSLSTCAGTEITSRLCYFTQSRPHGWPA
eukprot:5739069-Amphidinium_carterae.1